MDVADLLIQTKERGASDLHLSAGAKAMMRLHGELTPIDSQPLTRDGVHKMIYEILNDDQRRVFEEMRDLDFAIEIGDVARFRVNVFNQRNGEGAVFRVIPTQIRSFQELGFPDVVQTLSLKENGLVLVTGPTGSGKSTTLAAMIDLINSTQKKHIITLEDPIEFVHKSKSSLVNQREIGPHTKSFASALRAALREDPDVILVGEMRDLETIGLALTAAETGHLVFGTLHTKSAPKTIDRVIDAFPPAQQQQVRVQLAEALQGVVSQLLLPTKDKKGRVAALEIMVATVAIRNLIRESKTHQMPSAIQTGVQLGMQSLEQSLKTLLMKGAVDRAHAEAILASTSAGSTTQTLGTPSPTAAGATAAPVGAAARGSHG
jgi:twitching motility protein PilT